MREVKTSRCPRPDPIVWRPSPAVPCSQGSRHSGVTRLVAGPDAEPPSPESSRVLAVCSLKAPGADGCTIRARSCWGQSPITTPLRGTEAQIRGLTHLRVSLEFHSPTSQFHFAPLPGFLSRISEYGTPGRGEGCFRSRPPRLTVLKVLDGSGAWRPSDCKLNPLHKQNR